jgi:flagellar FliL protein
MAEAKKADDAGKEEQQPQKQKSKVLLIAIIAVVVVAIIGGGAAFFLMKKKPAADEEDGGDEEPVKTEKVKKKDHADAPPVFVKLDAFTVKLIADQQEAYLQAVPELRVLDAPTGDKIKLYTPEIRHKVLLILSGKKPSEISTPEGVQQLANEMRVTINRIIEPPPVRKKGQKKKEEESIDRPPGPDDPVQAVLFTSFIIQ